MGVTHYFPTGEAAVDTAFGDLQDIFLGTPDLFFFLIKKGSLKNVPGMGLIPNSARRWFLIWLKIAKLGISDA